MRSAARFEIVQIRGSFCLEEDQAMRRTVPILAVLVLAVTCGITWAERCVGPMDTTDWVTKDTAHGGKWNIPLFNQSDIVFCDDFDSYCEANYAGDDHPELSVFWPGYPPDEDDTLCTTPNPGVNSEWMMKEGYWTQPPTPVGPLGWSPSPPARNSWIYPSGPGSMLPGCLNFGVTNADPDHGGKRLEGWDGNGGWASLPYVAEQPGNQSQQGTAYYDFDMTGAIANRFSGSNAVNGTNDNPLVLRFWMYDDATLDNTDGWGRPANWPFYMELCFFGTDPNNTDPLARAPTDYVTQDCPGYHDCGVESVCVGGDHNNMPCTVDKECTDVDATYPIICQQSVTGLPANCPNPLINQPPLHASLAYGWLAALDTNPCDSETGRKPTMYHAVTFDGRVWRPLDHNPPPPGNGRFIYSMQQGFFEMTIRSTEYDLKLIAPNDCGKEAACDATCTDGHQICTSTITLPRQYTGPFNMIAMGIGPGCELDPANAWNCKTESTRNNRPWNWWWASAYVDRPVLFGGVRNLGSCCHVVGGTTEPGCSDNVPPGECNAWGDRFREGTCADTLCCPYPFADADNDGDVDQLDFAAFQLCYAGSGGGVPPGCDCWNRDKDNDVDINDFTKFNDCWTGPNVHWTPTDSCP